MTKIQSWIIIGILAFIAIHVLVFDIGLVSLLSSVSDWANTNSDPEYISP